jgi:cobalt-zinc-cadmium efflux system outer membrane protein
LAAVTPASALTISLSGIPSRVRASHPQLRAARLAIDEALGRHLAAGRLSNPTVEAEWRSESSLSPGAATLGIDQAFPITRRLHLEKELTARLVNAAELEVRDAERRLIAEAQALAVHLLARTQQTTLRQQQTELARKLSDFVSGRAKAGELSALDAAQAQVDAQRLLMEARKLETESVSFLGALKPMLGLAPSDSLIITGDLPPLTLPAKSSSWPQRADYQLSRTKIAAAQTDVQLAQANKWQDLTAGIFVGPEYQTRGGPDQRTAFAGFRVSLPLPFWNKNEGQIAEKAATAERARLEAQALSNQIISEADTARREMIANADLVRETRDNLLPLVIEQTDKLEKAYQNGQSDLLTVLRAREQRLQLQAASLDAARDFHLARIRYEAAIGKHAPAPLQPSSK